MKKKIIIGVITLFIYSVTAQNNPLDYIAFKEISDLDFSVFNNPKYSAYYNKKYNEKQFLHSFYSEWDYDKTTKHTLSENQWIEFFTYFGVSKNSPCYAGNYRKYTKDFLDKLTKNLPTDKEAFPHFVKRGILIKTADLRGLPTNEFCFRGMRDAGESYPFDNLQYSSIWIGTPITILSKTKDNLWYFVSTPNNKGWVESDKVAFVSDEQVTEIKNRKLGAVTKDNWLVKKDWNIVELHIGTILPISTNKNTTSISIPYKSFEDNYLVFKPFQINTTDDFQEFPIVFNAQNTKKILSNILGGKYSWGGIDGGRDCSSTLKDYLAPFGIWLPRNSSQQAKKGKMIALSGDNKEETIIKQGIPFLTSVYKRGHIVLYVGLDKKTKKQPLIYQTVWGIKAFYKDSNLYKISKQREKYGVFGIDEGNKKTVETRFIIGGTVITHLEPTKGFENIKKLKVKPFVKNMITMTIFSDK